MLARRSRHRRTWARRTRAATRRRARPHRCSCVRPPPGAPGPSRRPAPGPPPARARRAQAAKPGADHDADVGPVQHVDGVLVQAVVHQRQHRVGPQLGPSAGGLGAPVARRTVEDGRVTEFRKGRLQLGEELGEQRPRGHSRGGEQDDSAPPGAQCPRHGVRHITQLQGRFPDPLPGRLTDASAPGVVQDIRDGGPRDSRGACHVLARGRGSGRTLRRHRGHDQPSSQKRQVSVTVIDPA